MSKIEDEYEKKHLKRLRSFNTRIEQLYSDAISKVAQAAAGNTLPPDGFSISKFPLLNYRVNQVVGELRSNVEIILKNGIADAWSLSNQKNDAIVDRRITKRLKELPESVKFYDANAGALKAFQERKVKGLNLSDRVWNLVKSYRTELEAGLALGISEGKSATAMSRDLRQYLKDPDKLFRRVRDKNGVLQLSKNAANYHPGQGVYRSSFKNVLRLTRTETNLSYRSSDHLRWKSLPFVVGQEIKLSLAHPEYDICDVCAGRYPKGFVFTGWHPQCICYKVAIMMTDAEYEKYEDALLEGKTPRVRSVNSITDVPEGFKNFVSQNKSRIEGWKSTPYWVKENFKNGDIKQDFNFKVKKEKIIPTGDYSLNDQTIARLKDSGVTFDNPKRSATNFNNNLKGFDLQELYEELDEIGKDFDVEWRLKKITSLEGDIVGTRSVGYHKNGGEVVIDRRFREVDGKTEVYHALFTMPRTLQGGGMSKKVLAAYYKQYKKAGIHKIKVTANIDIGGYAWAKYGFSTPDQYGLLKELQRKKALVTNRQWRYVTKMVTQHFQSNPDKPFPMYKIANLGKINGTDYGKKLLLGTFWPGVLDLSNKKLKKVFETYLYGKTK